MASPRPPREPAPLDPQRDPFAALCTLCQTSRTSVWAGGVHIRACPACDLVPRWPRSAGR